MTLQHQAVPRGAAESPYALTRREKEQALDSLRTLREQMKQKQADRDAARKAGKRR